MSRPITFVYNDLYAVSTTALDQTEANVVDTLLKPNVRLTTSTPVSDPMDDYTWQLFRNADKAQAFAVRDGDTGGDLHGLIVLAIPLDRITACQWVASQVDRAFSVGCRASLRGLPGARCGARSFKAASSRKRVMTNSLRRPEQLQRCEAAVGVYRAIGHLSLNHQQQLASAVGRLVGTLVPLLVIAL